VSSHFSPERRAERRAQRWWSRVKTPPFAGLRHIGPEHNNSSSSNNNNNNNNLSASVPKPWRHRKVISWSSRRYAPIFIRAWMAQGLAVRVMAQLRRGRRSMHGAFASTAQDFARGSARRTSAPTFVWPQHGRPLGQTAWHIWLDDSE